MFQNKRIFMTSPLHVDYVAIIPARGGSKGILKKNLQKILGKPLIQYTIESAIQVFGKERCFVTSDCDEILMLASELGVGTIKRGEQLSNDSAGSEGVLLHALNEIARTTDLYANNYAFLQPTSPLRDSKDLILSLEIFKNTGTLISVKKSQSKPQKMLKRGDDGSLIPFLTKEDLTKPRQFLEEAFLPNGAIYLGVIKNFLSNQDFFQAPVAALEMSEEKSIDVDYEEDLLEVEKILLRQRDSFFKDAKIKYGKRVNFAQLNRTIEWRKEISKSQADLAKKVISECDVLENCPVCNNYEKTQVGMVYGFPYNECRQCNHVWSELIPNFDKIKNLYSGEGTEQTSQKAIYMSDEYFEKRIEMISFPKAKWASDFFNEKGLWVDVGCATGELLTSAKRLGWETLGIESDKQQVEFARTKGHRVFEGYLTKDNMGELLNSARIVSMLNLLEHLPDPYGWFESVVKATADDCSFVIEVPKHPSVSSFVNQMFPENSYRHMYSPDHLHLFSMNSLKKISEDFNLKPLGVWHFGQDIESLVYSIMMEKGDMKGNVNVIKNILPYLQNSLDQVECSDIVCILLSKKKYDL